MIGLLEQRTYVHLRRRLGSSIVIRTWHPHHENQSGKQNEADEVETLPFNEA
jgi:hypothetical protein